MNDFMIYASLYGHLLSVESDKLNETDRMLITQLASTLNKYARNTELALDFIYEDSIDKNIKMKKQEKFSS